MGEMDVFEGAAAAAEAGFTPEDIARIADDGVAATVRYAYRHSPYYRERFDSEGIRPEDVRSAADLAGLPFTDKCDLSRDDRAFWCVPQTEVVDIVTTSGTTGIPVTFPLTEGDIRRLAYNEYLSFAGAGLTGSDVVLIAVTLDKCFMAGMAYFEGLRRLEATSVRVGSGSPAMLLSMMERLGATAIVSVPSFLRRVAQVAAERGIDLRASTVKRAICVGEPIRTQEFALNALGRQVAGALGARVYGTYASTELATSFTECEAGAGGHLHPELLHVEVVDDAGRPVPDGQVGEIVVTTIGVEALPLVRWRSGDCAFLLRERCACGRWTPRLGPIVGRKNQMLKIKGTTVYPAGVQNVLDALGFVVDYVMIATSEADLSDRLEVVVAVRDGGASALVDIRESLRGALRVAPSVRLAAPEEIARIQDLETYRKKRVFVDRRRKET